MSEELSANKIIIEGVTLDGHKFRPTDWAERMCGSLSSFRDRRMTYSPLLRPIMLDGNNCVSMDIELKNAHPSMYNYVLEFAKENNLKVRNN